jgi:glucose-6-phosphate 1-dehydrogenase
MLFMRKDSVELAWAVLTPVLDMNTLRKLIPLVSYAAGSNGPDEAVHLIEEDGRAWRPL